MKKVFSSHDRMLVGLLRSILDDNGIGCVVKNEHLVGAMGELPPNECWPELWVVDDGDYLAAQRAVTQALHDATGTTSAWICPVCGEVLEGQFTACWHCGHAREEGRTGGT